MGEQPWDTPAAHAGESLHGWDGHPDRNGDRRYADGDADGRDALAHAAYHAHAVPDGDGNHGAAVPDAAAAERDTGAALTCSTVTCSAVAHAGAGIADSCASIADATARRTVAYALAAIAPSPFPGPL